VADSNVNQLVEHLFRHEAGKLTAVLTRLFGFPNYDIARDIVQETMLAALQNWSLHGIPDNPTGWLTTIAKNKTLDMLRRQKKMQSFAPALISDYESDEAMQNHLDSVFLDKEIEDSVLRMMFACCHPSLPIEAQITLILRTLCGLTIPEISSAFLSNDENINKRLYRAKDKIRTEKITLDVPTGQALLPRLDAVLKAVYLLFNEGYQSKSADAPVRHDLCSEAMRLTYLLIKQPITDLPKTNALLSLMCLQASRLDARQDANGNLVLLQHQDRQRWDQTLIERGIHFLNRASQGQDFSTYHLEAAIATYHAQATSFEQTNWQAILYLYKLLEQTAPSGVVSFNRAIATGFARGPKQGIEALLALPSTVHSHYYYVALGDFYVQLSELSTAKTHYETAIQQATSKAEWKLIWDKIERCT
jgi:RNA polymerase sigma factor (sigma-70 family)